MRRGTILGRMSLAAALTAIAAGALATEGGGSIYPNGVETFAVGAVPPPGLHYLAYGNYYGSNSVRDSNGNDVPLNFSLRAEAVAARVVWVTPVEVMGGNLAFHGILPIVNLSVTAGPQSQSKFGIGDITTGGGVGFHASPNLHYVFAVDLNMPTGAYTQSDMANIGRNYWNIEPLAIVTFIQPEGINADLKVMYDINFRNSASQYLSGQEFHADYAVGWGFNGSWVVGVGGYVYFQTTNDDVNGTTVVDPVSGAEGNKGRAIAIGPTIKYDSGRHWFVTAKWQYEFGVENRAQGSAVWLKAIVPL